MSVFLKVVKKISSAFREKPTVEPDDFELEHFLLYHGLVGTSPEGQRKFKDVKADIKLAMESNSSAQMSIALKLLPLWWEDKLQSIFDELDRESAIELLTPDRQGSTDTNNEIPLFHESWKVRANTARMLAHLKATQKASELEASLESTRESTKLALCHILYSLGKLGEKSSLDAVSNYLQDPDPWLKVDAMGSYAQLCRDSEDERLQESIFDPHLFTDYSAVQITRYIPLENFLNSPNQKTRLAGLKLVSGICQAGSGTFGAELAHERGLDNLYKDLLGEPHCQESSPVYYKTLVDMKSWLEENGRFPHAALIEKHLEESRDKVALESYIKEKEWKELAALQLCELEAAIFLVGKLGANNGSCASILVDHLNKPGTTRLFTDEILESLAWAEPAPENLDRDSQSLVALAETLVSLDSRTEETRSAQPVVEENPDQARTYFRVLKALGKYPTDESLKYLSKASADYASDKRNQAFKSLVEIASGKKEFIPEVGARVMEGLEDNSLEVRMTTLKGVVALELIDSLDRVLELTGAREVSLANQALATLSDLAENGHRKPVLEALKAKLKSVKNQFHREKLSNVLENIEKHGN